MSARDYYEVLGVSRQASESEIKSAYRKLAMQNHPDRNPGDAAAEERFKEAAEAYSVLGDADKRGRYDRFGHQGVSGAAGNGPQGFDPSMFSDFGDLGDILGSMFGGAFGGQRRGGAQRGADLRYDLEITFEEAARGYETPIQIPRLEACAPCQGSGAAPGTTATTCATCRGRGQVHRQQGFFAVAVTCPQCRGNGRTIATPCTTCQGQGRVQAERKLTVKIPAGIATGQQLRIAGEGEAGVAGGPSGHLYVVVHVKDHPFFHRDGVNLFCEIPVHFTTLALGGDVQVPTLEEPETVKVPEGTQTGHTLRLKGKGLPDVNGRGRGDILATVQVQTPRKLTKEQRKLLEQLAASLPTEAFQPRSHADGHHERNLFDRVKDMFN